MLKSLNNLKVIANYMELSSRGVSQKTWDKMNSLQREEYIKNNPTSKYADPDNNSSNQVKPVKELENKDYNYQRITPEIRDILNNCVKDTRHPENQVIENEDGSIDVEGNLNFANSVGVEKFDKLFLDENGHLKYNFNKVSGDFCFPDSEKLSSLEGSPKEVGRTFNCCNCNGLKNLIGAPEDVGFNFFCNKCEKLESLEGAPKRVHGDFSCENCKSLTSLKGGLDFVGRNFRCRWCSKLESLEGAPKQVMLEFCCFECGKKFTKRDVKKYCNVFNPDRIYC